MSKVSVHVRVSGEYACFTRPETKVERLSYETPTPSAARGILDAILWHPAMRWHVRSIAVLRPIRFQALRRSEVQTKMPVGGGAGVYAWMADPRSYRPQEAGGGSANATLRNTLALREVAYLIEAEPVSFGGTPAQRFDAARKYGEMFDRRVRKGQCFHAPALGCREFVAAFEPPVPGESPIAESRDLGRMLYDIAFDTEGRQNRPIFFEARLENGVVNTDARRVIGDEALRRKVLGCSSRP